MSMDGEVGEGEAAEEGEAAWPRRLSMKKEAALLRERP